MPEPIILSTGKDGELSGITTQQIDAMFAEMANHDKVVLHFHGGLISDESGRNIARSLDDDYRAAGAFPVFFVWQSGLLEVLRHNLAEIAGEDFFKIILKYVTKFAMGKVQESTPGGKAIGFRPLLDMEVNPQLARKDAGQEPFAEVEVPADKMSELTDEQAAAFTETLLEDPDFQETVQAIAESLVPEQKATGARGIETRRRASTRTLMSPEVVAQIRADVEAAPGSRGILSTASMIRNALRVLARVVDRFRNGRAHGVYPTIVEEILREFYVANAGVAVWKAMKGETSDTFVQADPVRGGHYFAGKLNELVAGGKKPQITLVGHSTGAVFINNMLTHFRKLREAQGTTLPGDFAFQNVVFLAPACTFDDFATHVVKPYFSASGETLYRNLRMYTMNDESECKDALVPFVYPRSLLYFISGVLEPDQSGKSAADMPIVGMQRYFNDTKTYTQKTIAAVRDFVKGDAKRAVWSPINSGPGLSSGALKHTTFDEDKETLASLRHLIASGF